MYKYRVRVRQEVFLWGSAGLAQNVSFAVPLLLHIRNDVHGEQINFGTLSIDGTRNTIGKLEAGECVSIPVQNIQGVFANCNLDSCVTCVISSPHA